MLDNDVLFWLVQIIDTYLTAQHNSQVEQAKNPKKKPNPGRKFRFTNWDTFGGQVMPERLKSIFVEEIPNIEKIARKWKVEKMKIGN